MKVLVMSNGEDIKNLADKLANINIIKSELAALDLNPRLKRYYEFNVEPLLITINLLSGTLFNLAGSLSSLALVTKSSQTKDISHLVKKMQVECEDIYDALSCRIDELICIAEHE